MITAPEEIWNAIEERNKYFSVEIVWYGIADDRAERGTTIAGGSKGALCERN
jgi:hypothetical protein